MDRKYRKEAARAAWVIFYFWFKFAVRVWAGKPHAADRMGPARCGSERRELSPRFPHPLLSVPCLPLPVTPPLSASRGLLSLVSLEKSEERSEDLEEVGGVLGGACVPQIGSVHRTRPRRPRGEREEERVVQGHRCLRRERTC